MTINIDKISTIFIDLLLMASFFFILRSSCERPPLPYLQNAEHRVDSLKKESIKKDSLLQISDLKIDTFRRKETILIKDNIILKARIRELEAHRQTISSQVENMSSDTIYALLQETYPTRDSLKLYPFSSSQVKSIYLTKLEHSDLLRSDSVHVSLVENLEQQLTLKDSIIMQKESQTFIYQDKLSLSDQIIINKDEFQKLTLMELEHEKRTKFYWQLGAVGAAVIAVLAIL